MLKLPKGKEECTAILREMISLKNDKKYIVSWLKSEFERMVAANISEDSVSNIRRRQGGLSTVKALLDNIENAKDKLMEIENGAT